MSVLTDPGTPPAGQGIPPASGTPPGNQDWRTNLPEDLRSEKVFESIKGKDWNEAGPLLAKGYVNAQRMVGADKIIMPGEKATPEEWGSFYTKIGRPEKPEGYSYQVPEGVKPEQLNKEVLGKWLKNLHDAGVPKASADKIISQYLADELGSHNAGKAAKLKQAQDWEMSLKQEFGQKFDEKLNYAKLALKDFGDDKGELVKFLDDTGLGDNPAIVKFFARVGESMADDRARGGSGDGGARFNGGAPRTPAEAQAAINVFNRDEAKQKALRDTSFEGREAHNRVVQERMDLFHAAFPKEQKE